MGKNNTKTVILGLIAIFISSIIIIPVSALVVRGLISDNNRIALFIFDLTATVSMYDMLSLYFTIVAIGVTGLLTWAIFAFSQKKELDESNKKRMWIYSEILFLLNQVFQHQKKGLSAFTISNDWMAHVCYCHEFLSNEQYSKLLEFYGKCNRLMAATYENNRSNIDSLAENILNDTLMPFYTIYKYEIGSHNVAEASTLLRSDYIDILNAIYPNKRNILPLNYCGKYNNGNDLYSYDKHTEIYKVWSYDGTKPCEATFKDWQIWTGHACLNYYTGIIYTGSFVEGKKNGNGIEVHSSYHLSDNPVKEGIWQDDQLLSGEVRNFPLGNSGKNVKDVKLEIEYSRNINIADYDVIDGILGEEKNARTAT